MPNGTTFLSGDRDKDSRHIYEHGGGCTTASSFSDSLSSIMHDYMQVFASGSEVLAFTHLGGKVMAEGVGHSDTHLGHVFF